MIDLARPLHDKESWPEVDRTVMDELTAAKINVEGPVGFLREMRSVPAAYVGDLCGWWFRRERSYWIAEGPGIPPDKAEEFHKTWGRELRVDGHCACPSPLEWCHGFAVGTYHIDTQAGLNAFAELLRSIYVPAKGSNEENPFCPSRSCCWRAVETNHRRRHLRSRPQRLKKSAKGSVGAAKVSLKALKRAGASAEQPTSEGFT